MKFAVRIHFKLSAQEVEDMIYFMSDGLGVKGTIDKDQIEKYWFHYTRDAFRDGKYKIAAYRTFTPEQRASVREMLAEVMEEQSGAE